MKTGSGWLWTLISFLCEFLSLSGWVWTCCVILRQLRPSCYSFRDLQKDARPIQLSVWRCIPCWVWIVSKASSLLAHSVSRADQGSGGQWSCKTTSELKLPQSIDILNGNRTLSDLIAFSCKPEDLHERRTMRGDWSGHRQCHCGFGGTMNPLDSANWSCSSR